MPTKLRWGIVSGCLSLLLSGCGRQPPPVAAAADASVTPLVAVAGNADFEQPAVGTVVHDGRTAPQWLRQLETAQTPVLRQQAGRALSDMGAAGVPQLLVGLKSPSDEVRLSSLQAISQPALAKNSRETLPLLLNLLGERNPTLRKAAAARLPWFPWKRLDPETALRAMAQRDEDAGVRRAAQESIIFINEVVTGTMDYGPK